MSFDPTWLAWAGVISMILVGIAGTVLPALPGVLLVLGGIVWGAWLDGFTLVPVSAVVVCAVLGALAFATDYVAAAMGAKKVRASGWALAGAAVGTVLGIFTGFIGLLFMPLAGAMAGEWWALRGRQGALSLAAGNHAADGKRALEVGVATWIGMMVGTAVKLALVFLMVGVFAFAYWF